MKSLTIRQTTLESLTEIHSLLKNSNKLEAVQIEASGWNYPEPATTFFKIVRNNEALFIYYNVKERQTTAEHSPINSQVWQDSCVEFFIKINEKEYQNFEFNCCGVPLSATGESRHNRRFLTDEELKRIEVISTFDKKDIPFKLNNSNWEMTIKIPYDIIKTNCIFTEKNEYLANFYKCNENSDFPHFLTWNEIKTEKPDFHRPEFFGKLLLDNKEMII
ncbi:MAG: hypothetical protein JXR63_13155 [Spirochaetales bacterium]|nr:hypothetical protein [Spirochaetales bacterium]